MAQKCIGYKSKYQINDSLGHTHTHTHKPAMALSIYFKHTIKAWTLCQNFLEKKKQHLGWGDQGNLIIKITFKIISWIRDRVQVAETGYEKKKIFQ